MTKRETAEALVAKMSDNGRFGSHTVDKGEQLTIAAMVMKLPVAEIKRRLALEERGVDCRRSVSSL